MWCETDKKIQVDWDVHKRWCVVQRKQYLVACWFWDKSDTGFRILEVESCTGNIDSHGDTSTQARIFCWAMSFLSALMIASISATHRLHLPVVFCYSMAFFRTSQLCSGIPWPSSAPPTTFPLPSLFIQGLVSFVLCICLKIGLGRETFSCNHKSVRLIL